MDKQHDPYMDKITARAKEVSDAVWIQFLGHIRAMEFEKFSDGEIKSVTASSSLNLSESILIHILKDYSCPDKFENTKTGMVDGLTNILNNIKTLEFKTQSVN